MSKVDFTPRAEKQLKKIADPERQRIYAAALALGDNPQPNGCQLVRGKPERWRVRVGNYRVVYELSGETVYIIRVGHRRDVYRNLLL